MTGLTNGECWYAVCLGNRRAVFGNCATHAAYFEDALDVCIWPIKDKRTALYAATADVFIPVFEFIATIADV